MRRRAQQLIRGVAVSATVLANVAPGGIHAAFAQASGHWKHFPPPATAPAGAPNVLLIMTDDVGFGAASTFGGPVPTPTFDSLAKTGTRTAVRWSASALAAFRAILAAAVSWRAATSRTPGPLSAGRF